MQTTTTNPQPRRLVTDVCLVLACWALLPHTPVQAAETAETILIRAALDKDLAGRRRANLDLLLGAYDEERFVVYDGGGSAAAGAWSPIYIDGKTYGRDLLPNLQAQRHDIERAVIFMGIWKDKAFVTTIDSGVVIDRQSDSRTDYRSRSLWTFAKKDDQWRATGLIQAFGDTTHGAAASGIANADVAAMLQQEAAAWGEGSADGVTNFVADEFVAVESKFSANPASWVIIFADRDEYGQWLEQRLAHVDYTVDRKVEYATVGPGGEEAVAVTRDQVRAAPRAGSKVYEQERITYWLLHRQGGDWVASWAFWKSKQIPLPTAALR